MDTGTHLVMGIALGGLTVSMDPVVASSSTTAHAIMVGTILGSQAPDLDTLLKLKNNAKYIRNHRGITHSVPAVLLWPLLISGAIYLFTPDVNVFHVWIWTFLAVFLHVFVDIFNAYGTQALRPFSKKWVAIGVINTFDPFIFFAHIVGLIIWRYGGSPFSTFITMYIVIFFYYILRFYSKFLVTYSVKSQIEDVEEIIVSPTYRFFHWHVAIITKNHFYVAKAYKSKVTILDVYKKLPVPNNPIMNAAKKDDNLSAFLSFSPVYRWEIDTYDDYYEVRFIDLRYRSKGFYPFVAVVQLDQYLTISSSYTGWIFSEEKLMKKLGW